ncbi:MAG: ion transporter [Mariprofundaceae bacterium]|nr:ion transporter [Mariprofundaceae bacterium]
MLDTRMLRVVRLFRIFKLTRHFGALEILFKVIRNELRSLGAALFVLLVLIVLASAGMYVAERGVQPEAFGNIPKAMWWATVTLTTVGYGDVVPITTVGRFFSGIIVILGIGIAALPAGIIAAGFTQELQRRREAFRLVAHKVVADGVIDENERHLLEATRKDLDMDRDEARMVLHEELLEKKTERESTRCPHCGKPLEKIGEDGAGV